MTKVKGALLEYAKTPKSPSFRPMVYLHGSYGSRNNQQLFSQTKITCGKLGPKLSGPTTDPNYRGPDYGGTVVFGIYLVDLQKVLDVYSFGSQTCVTSNKHVNCET